MTTVNFPKVLVIGINAWREDGTAHTLMNIFRCWDPEKLALVYTRTDLPNTRVCRRYFQISESQIIKNIINPWSSVGRVVNNTESNKSGEMEAEHRRYSNAHKRNLPFLPLIRELIWKFGGWKSSELRDFVKDFDPDIIFVPIYPTVYMGRLQRYIIKLTGKPTACYLADDNYSYDSCDNIWKYIHRFWLRRHIKPLASGCKQMFVIVEKEKEDTDARFGTNSQIITKGIDFGDKTFVRHTPNQPLKFVYTGNLLIGRDRTLALLADAINTVNKNGIKAELYIYSQTEPNSQILKRLDNGASHFCGQINREQVIKVQQDADVVVFAEALEGKEANVAKLSFSTKITDYLSSGKCIIAIGKEDIAPIDYFRRYDAALIANSAEDIFKLVNCLITHSEIVNIYGEKAFKTAIQNHDKALLNKRFIDAMLKIVNTD